MVNKWVIRVKDVPFNTTVENYILKNTDISEQIKKFKHQTISYLKLPIHLDLENLITDTKEALSIFKSYSFQYKNISETYQSYISSSLTWNPHSIDKLSDDPHQSTLGSSLYSNGNADSYISDANKNSYADSYGFNERTELSKFKSLGKMIDMFDRTLIRSRISKIIGSNPESNKINYLWHKDESIFLNLRVNIPVQSSSSYVIQIMTENPHDYNQVDINEIELITGSAYAYNTELLHRPYSKNLNSPDRINLICGVSPWFDFNIQEQTWQSNEYYGRIHPFQMLNDGLICRFIKK